jgi:hypothetical protein
MNPEDMLSDALHDRVEHTDYPSTPLSTVSGRAGALRARRRRTTFLAAAAAVAVVTVPGAAWLGRSPGSSPRPGHTTSSGPTSSPTEQTSVPPSMTLDSLPMGQKPGIDYLVGDTYVTMNGDRITHSLLTKAVAATPGRGGILVATHSQLPGMGDVVLETESGDQRLGCGSERFAMSTDGTQSAYWLMDSCTAGSAGKLYSGVNNGMGESGAGYVATPPGSVFEPIGIVRQGTVVNVTKGNTGHSEIVDASGSGAPIPGLALAGGSDENNDVVSGQVAGDSETGIVVHASTGVPVASFPSWTMGQFSPDGKYVLGVQRGDGVPDTYAIFDALDGRRVTDVSGGTLASRFVSDPVWDFNDTLLAPAGGADGSAIVRIDLQGNWTLATPIVHGHVFTAGYRLATRP